MMDIKKFLLDGWVIADLPDSYAITIWKIVIDAFIEEKFKCGINELDKIPDEIFKTIHIEVSKKLWEMRFSECMGEIMLPLAKELIGMDVMVQSTPYFRIARPNRPDDNIGYHRDTHYGQTPYELNVHIPFVDLNAASALRVINGSHLFPDSIFEDAETMDSPIEKGSIENRTGRPYAPKRLRVPYGMETTPMTIKAGQVAFFSPALFHGQEINSGLSTRISIDWHGIVNTRAPIKIRESGAQGGYKKISKSPVEQQAEEYYEVQNV